MSGLETLNNEFYIPLLEDVGIFDKSGEGLLSFLHNGEPLPVTIDGKRLVLPIQQILKDGDWDKRIPFSPLSEQINQGPSPVLVALKGYIHQRITYTIKVLALELLELAIDPARQKKLNAKAGKLLAPLADADQKTLDTLKRVIDAVSDAPEKRIVTMYLMPKGEDGALRTCKVSFPILDEADNGETGTFFGVKMPRKKDKAIIVALFRDVILGGSEAINGYSCGSVNQVAPFLHSMLSCFSKFIERLNMVLGMFSKHCDALMGLEFTYGWKNAMENFDEFANKHSALLPPMPGNRGKEKDAVEKPTKAYNWGVPKDEAEKEEKIDVPWDTDEGKSEAPRLSASSARSSFRTSDRERDREPARRDDGVVRKSLDEILGRKRSSESSSSAGLGRSSRIGRRDW